MIVSSHSSVPFRYRGAGLLPALALGLAMLPFRTVAAPSADDIEIVATKGDVEVSMDGVALAAKAGSTLDLPAELRTGHDGSADLRQGPTTIGVGPDTKLSFPAPAERDAPVDRVVQPQGNAFYNVGARGKDRLRVETPYLVAVIKGTQFNVVVDAESSTISLFEGSLEVLATDGDAIVQLSAGEIAIRRRGDETITVLRMKDQTIASAGGKGGKGDEPAKGTPGTTAAGPVAGTLVVPTPTGADVTGGVDIDIPVLPIDPVEGKVKLAIGGDGDGLAIDAGVSVGAGPVGVDAGVDVGIDAGAGTIDAGVDASVDVGLVGVDLGVDAGVDLGAGTIDATVDAGVDLGPVDVDLAADAGIDAGAGSVEAEVNAGALGVDAGVDVGVDLAGPDAGVDLGVDLLGAEIDLGVDLGLGLDLGLGGDTSMPDTSTPAEDTGGGGGLGGLLGGLLGRPRP